MHVLTFQWYINTTGRHIVNSYLTSVRIFAEISLVFIYRLINKNTHWASFFTIRLPNNWHNVQNCLHLDWNMNVCRICQISPKQGNVLLIALTGKLSITTLNVYFQIFIFLLVNYICRIIFMVYVFLFFMVVKNFNHNLFSLTTPLIH